MLAGHKKWYAKDHSPIKDLSQVVKELKPTIIIGASATPGLFTPEILQDMAKFNQKPIVFGRIISIILLSSSKFGI